MSRILLLALLVVVVGAAPVAHAQARGPSVRTMRDTKPTGPDTPVLDESTRISRIEAMERWLSQLVGRYRVDGIDIHVAQKVTFKADATCESFGDGHGVRCIIRKMPSGIDRQPGQFRARDIQEELLLPVLVLGIDPEHVVIQAIVVDTHHIMVQPGAINGETVRFGDAWNQCGRLWTDCWLLDEIKTGSKGATFIKLVVDNWMQGSRGLPMSRLKSGHNQEVELQLRPIDDNPGPSNTP
jgi:hypothetical protein